MTGAPAELDDPAVRARLGTWLAGALGADRVEVRAVRPLSGGAIQQNLLLELRADGAGLDAVLRRDAPATIPESRSRAEEHALLAAAHAAGVAVPRPLGFCDDASIVGAPFSLTARVDGVGLGQKVVKDLSLGGDREALVMRLGRELATIHAIDVDDPSLAFLHRDGRAVGNPPGDVRGDAPEVVRGEPASAIRRLRTSLDALGAARPALEAGLRRLELAPPPAHGRVLLHRDFRTGNLMLDGAGLAAILDWEFAGPGDPMEDLGWFCARCWRFSRPDLEAGGLGSRAAFYRGYAAASGRSVDDAAVRWWERYAHARWAVIALQQGERHASGRERSLALALTGRLAAGLELHLLDATARTAPGAPGAPAGPAGPPDADPHGGDPPGRGGGIDGDDDEGDDGALLDAVRGTLEPLARGLEGKERLAVLMSAAALGSVRRARDVAAARAGLRARLLEVAGADDERGLVARLRDGGHDRDAGTARALLEATALEAWVARPGDVDGALRVRHGLAPGGGAPLGSRPAPPRGPPGPPPGPRFRA